MLSKNLMTKSVSLLTLVAVWCTFSMVALAGTKDANGEVTVIGQVSVNGTAVATGATIVSGSTITTGEGSTATISLGKAGRVELLANSNATLRFSASEITAVISSGKIRVNNNAGVATTVAARSATVIADASQSNSFAVELECGHTHVDSIAGIVTMRTGEFDKQVAAGTSEVAGNMNQTGCQPCYRADKTPLPVASIGALPIAAILLLVGGTIGTAIIVGTQGDSTTTGTTVVVSPVR